MPVLMNSFATVLHIEDAAVHSLWAFASENATPVPAHTIYLRNVSGAGATICNEDGTGQFQVPASAEPLRFDVPAGSELFVKADGPYVDEVLAVTA